MHHSSVEKGWVDGVEAASGCFTQKSNDPSKQTLSFGACQFSHSEKETASSVLGEIYD